MVTGVKTFNTSERQVSKFEKVPPPAKNWEARVDTGKWSIAVGEESRLPYIKASFELLNSATKEGGKNRWIYHNFFLDITPSKKDQKAMVDRQGGVTDFSKAVATELNLEGDDVIMDKERPVKDSNGKPTGEFEPCQVLNPQVVLQWFKQFDGSVIKLRSKIRKGTNGYADQGEVDYFIEADQ